MRILAPGARVLVAVTMLLGLGQQCYAQADPKPDPSGPYHRGQKQRGGRRR